jgi:hypothetical protein
MSLKLCTLSLCCLFFLADGCDSKLDVIQNSSPVAPASSATNEASPKPVLDACRLLSSSEIESIQGAHVQAGQPTTQKHGNLDISQCYYPVNSADGLNLSVFVQVIQRDPKSGPEAVSEFWKERFKRKKEEGERVEKEEQEEEERIRPPVTVSGIGDEAFWLASDRGGALYVLTNDKVVRVSAGGTNDAQTRLENPKALAKKIVERLM